MAFVNKRDLKRHYAADRRTCLRQLSEAIETKALKPSDFSIRDLAESLIKDGDEWVASLRAKRSPWNLLEATATVTSDFSNITGQIVYTAIRDAYESEEFVFSKMVPGIKSEFEGIEKIPGITRIGDKMERVGEGKPYPLVGPSEDWVEVGAKIKRGAILPLTKEAVMFDRTGDLLRRAAGFGEECGINKEKRIIDAFIDGNTGATSIVSGGHRFHWKGTSYATYQASTPWINVKTSTALDDWTDVEAAELVFAALTDPYTGEPINIMPDTLVVCPEKLHTAKRIVSATEIRNTAGGFATSGNPMQTSSPNTINNYKIVSSKLLAARLTAASVATTTWFLSNIPKMLSYYYNWEMVTDQAPAGHPAEFDTDIVSQYKVSEKAVVATMEPRASVKATA